MLAARITVMCAGRILEENAVAANAGARCGPERPPVETGGGERLTCLHPGMPAIMVA